MSIISSRALLLGSATYIGLIAAGDVALTQEPEPTELPPIEVTAPRPIPRPPATRRVSTPATPARTTPAPAPAPVEIPSAGVLPIAVDQFGTITVVPNEELRRNPGATLGDLLQNKPGITGSSFAPGASSRPIIRGLDANRVGIVSNGLGGGGVSDLGEDHFVPVNPLTSNQVEVIRGPGALRFGSQAIGGVVSATDNRIPAAFPDCRTLPSPGGLVTKAPLTAKQPGCVNFETRSAVSTVDGGLEGSVLLDARGGNFAFHADAFGRKADDYRIPSYPYRFEPGRPFSGRQPNSSLHMDGAAVGGSYIFDQGFIGATVVQDNAFYHIPSIDGEDHRTRIDARQTKVMSKGEWRSPTTMIDAIRFWAGVTDYRHNEIGFADPGNAATDGVRQTFTNKEQEGRVEAQFKSFKLPFAQMTTTVGIQAGHQQLTAPGDAPGPFSGLFDPNSNKRMAAYVFDEFKFSDKLKAQVAGRIEHVDLTGSMPDILAGGSTPIARNASFTPMSASFGLIQNLPWNLVGSFTAQHIERAPKPAELFSRGPHDATGTFDIGNPNLKIETANSIEAGLRRAVGPIRFEATAYYTRFNAFIFRNLTGFFCEATPDTCTGPNPPFTGAGGELKQAIYSQKDAIFRGGEFQFQYDVAPIWTGMWGVEGQYDIVRATFTDGTNVPRIPPQRIGGGFFWRDAHWFARINLLHAFAQNNIAQIAETTTPGYNRLKAELSYTEKLKPTGFGPREINVGIVGDNLLNENIRNSVSYTKDEVLLPGANVRIFANVKY